MGRVFRKTTIVLPHYWICLVGLLCLSLVVNLSGQTEFPAAWSGEWEGELSIYRGPQKVDSLPMELHILPIDTLDRYSWTIIYGEDKVKGRRSYSLMVIDAETGHYAIDEHNSIILDAYLNAGKFYSCFSIDKSMVVSITELVGDSLTYEFLSGNLDPVRVSGDTVHQGDTIPAVSSYAVPMRHLAILRRKGK